MTPHRTLHPGLVLLVVAALATAPALAQAPNLETLELPRKLVEARELLLAGEWEDARKAARRAGRFRGGGETAAIALAFEALAEQELGLVEDARCHWSRALYLWPELDDATTGSLPALEEPVPVRSAFPEMNAGARPLGEDEDFVAPQKVSTPPPSWMGPQTERVAVLTSIDEEGRMGVLRVANRDQIGNRFALSVLDALCRWRFEPARLEGEPIAVSYVVTMGMRVERGGSP